MNVNRTSLMSSFALLGLLVGTPIARAQVATTIEKADIAGLSPEIRAEVQKRATNGNTVSGVLTTMLLNNIKLKHPAGTIKALDFGRGTAVIETAAGATETVTFDKTTLKIKE